MARARTGLWQWQRLVGMTLAGLLVIGGCTLTGVWPAATITSIDVTSGPSTGGTRVRVTGTRFASGVEVRFGGALASITAIISDAEVEVTTPPSSPGTVDVSVGFAGGISNRLPAAFTYVRVPQIVQLSPNSGPVAGGTPVIVTGAGFDTGASVVVGGAAATSVSVQSETELTFLTPAGTKGVADVTITNIDLQGATLGNAFTYVGPPVPAALVPWAGAPAGGQTVTLTGTDFQPGLTVTVGGAAAVSLKVVSATKVTFTVPPGSAGAADVTVTNPDGAAGTLAGAYTYTTATAPTISALDVTVGPRAGGTAVTISGTGFQAGALVFFDGAAASVSAATPTSLEVLTPLGLSGPADVLVVGADGLGASLPGAFTYAPRPLFVLHTLSRTLDVLGLDEDVGSVAKLSGGIALTPTLVPRDVATVTNSAATFAYVSFEGGQIHGFQAAADGKLSVVAGSPFTAGGVEPFSLTTATVGVSTFLYAVNRDAGTVSGFSVNPSSGALTSVGSAVSTGGIGPRYAVFAPLGGGSGAGGADLLFVTNSSSSTLAVFTVAAGGVLTPALDPFPSQAAAPLALAFGRDRLFVAHGASVAVYNVALAGGAVTVKPVAGSPFVAQGTTAAGRAIAFSEGGGAGGRVVLAVTFLPGLSVFDVDASGALAPTTLTGPAATKGVSPQAVAVLGARAYVLHVASSHVAVFDLPGPAMAPIAVTGSPFQTGGLGPVAFAFGD